MTRVSFTPEEFYHVYNRGTEKRKIFLTKADYARFTALMHACNQHGRIESNFRGPTSNIFSEKREKTLVDIVAYCLMPNHFHLLVREKETGGISKFMQKVMTGYTMYFNKKTGRTGVLFQGKFKASHVDKDNYFKYLVAYIHLNPLKLIDSNWKENGIVNHMRALQFLNSFTYSSFTDYEGSNRPESVLLNKELMSNFFDSSLNFKTHVKYFFSDNYKDEKLHAVRGRTSNKEN